MPDSSAGGVSAGHDRRHHHLARLRQRQADNGQADLSIALAAMTAERDDLKLQLESAMEELSQRRMQVAEMRSLIEAMSNGVSSGPLPGSAMAAIAEPGSPEVRDRSAQYVSEVLEEAGEQNVADSGAAAPLPPQSTRGLPFAWDRRQADAAVPEPANI